ncbi:MAG: hypothetical protein NVS3B25_33230 [Hymenobacter sp.]
MQWATLNILDTKKNDAGVATGWTLLLAMRFSRPKPPPVAADLADLRSYFRL